MRTRSLVTITLGSFVGWMLLLTACVAPPPPVPPISQFTQPAIGTPIPPELIAAPVRLPPDGSGVAFYNQKGALMYVALSDTISIISPTYGFLFVLAPGTYNFYVYENDGGASLSTEKVEPGKVRYVYVYPINPDLLIH